MASDNSLFDRTLLHENARKAIDTGGDALLAIVAESSLEPQRTEVFPGRREAVDTITDEDIIGEPLLAFSDWSGSVIARCFVRDGREIALRNQGYSDLRKLVDKVLRMKPFSSGMSHEFIEVEIFKWWRGRLRNETSMTLSLFLLDAAEHEVGGHEIIVPLTAVELERGFMIGDVLVAPFDRALFEDFGKKAAEKIRIRQR